ncbi:formyltetrahydrofolate deformylase [Amphritea opalescens]|uniref:Formyltetrahydrofolate deformylase n=1 Tax=Amphritea opalescens TaxID=2490544 RepID=A0A430KTA7_9GAMM|nr:formyltetrahydrofolate deformylase [Amphritea opalescens]RTE66688.1 formyltetrahydrofolate deformylase [Amphritea opalescens]
MKINKKHSTRYTLTINCPTAPGVVAGVSTYLAERGCDIVESAQFDDQSVGRLFMRIVFNIMPDSKYNFDNLVDGFSEVAEKFSLSWKMRDSNIPSKVLIMVSKFDHCLDDLLYRYHKGEFNMDITAVVSNHLDLRPMVEREGIRFIYLPVSPENKVDQENKLLDIVKETETDLVVLARYMQVLTDNLCKELRGRAINIHHSFLPGFKGAKPYHQAFDRGVKLIGATAHYVTADLDEGPIITQSVQEVDHSLYAEELVAVGRDTETRALAKAVKLHIEQRVFLEGNKTVVLR